MLTPKRTSIVTDVVRRFRTMNRDLGKIQLQKLVYFLQESGIDLGYSYDFYHYGPFSFELADDIETLNTIGGLAITPDKDGYGYHINMGNSFKSIDHSRSPFPKGYIEIIEKVLSNFSSCDSADLELRATIHYVHQIFKKRKGIPKLQLEQNIIDQVQKLKPKFSSDNIRSAYRQLAGLKLLK